MQASPATCHSLVAAYRDGKPLRHCLKLRLGRTRLALRGGDAGLMDALAGHYRDFGTDEADPPDLTIAFLDRGPVPFSLPFAVWEGADEVAKEEFVDLADGRVVRKRRTGLWLVFGPAGHFVLGPCRRHVDQVINYVNARAADRELAAGASLLHAAGVAVGERGLAVAGLAGAGKSTLALELVRRGADFVSNDRLLVGPSEAPGGGLAMTGVARMPRVNPGTLLFNDSLAGLLPEADRAVYAGLADEELWRLERKYDVPIRDCFGPGRFRLRVPCQALVLLCWRPGGGAMAARRIGLAERPELVAAITKDVSVLFAQGPRRARPEDYLRLLADCPVLLLEGGTDFHRAADRCLALLAAPGA
ncbi:MAG: HprK-related kinase B [Solidesulfovibrio sp. DCME]|uniref:HprK-related kinase B n=1 Tax=Solidesulfovibrio sp. DCME TaxID=3447380 RepID=UPI003D0B3FB3